MGDMGSGGAPRIRNIVAHLTTLAESVVSGMMRTTLHRGDGTEIGTASNPIHVDIGGDVPDTVGIAQIGGSDVDVGTGSAGSGTLRVAVAVDDPINTALGAMVLRGKPVKTAATGSGVVDVSHAPGVAFTLDVVTIHLSTAPISAGDLTIVLKPEDGVEYDTVLFRIDPSDGDVTDICFVPDQPILCLDGDSIVVEYANDDSTTYGIRIATRAV